MDSQENHISPTLSRRLKLLAEKYENAEFMTKDPSQFMHAYTDVRDIEIIALLSACLAFGRREQILSHIRYVINCMNGQSPALWILEKQYCRNFPDSTASFYRVFSFRAMLKFFDALHDILSKYHSLGECVKRTWENSEQCSDGGLATQIASFFPQECSPLIAHTATSANKRLNLFLRWMVRQNSPVDMGLWTWFSPRALLIPLDVHVVTVAKQFKLLPQKATPSLRCAIALTQKMSQIFPDDPLKGDFALFGHGVDAHDE